MKILTGGVCAVLLAALAYNESLTAAGDSRLPPTLAATCESLASLKLPNTEITMALAVPAGQFAPAGILAPGAPSFRPYNALAPFCRVAATLRPSSDSDIKIEVWMPASGWNGKFEAVGNGGWAGSISVQALAAGIARGYAIATTDTGHENTKENKGDGSFALNHPEKVTDFAYRAVHEMTVQAKALVQAYYGKAPAESYWDGCSTGGRQGLKEAQRYPVDYDGIIAGTPTNYMTHLMAEILWDAHAALKDPASYIPKEKYPMMHAAVLAACDAIDGLKDGVIDDPTRCHFDPKTIQCRAEDAPTCLTAAQVEAARKIYSPVKNPRTGAEIFPGLEPGSELYWGMGLAAGPDPMSIGTDYFKYIVFKNPNWDYKTFDFDKDVALADAMDNGADNAIDPNLKAFFGRGGKLLMYHGWADMLVAPSNTVNYYTSVVRAMGGAAKVNDSMRLFMEPGVGHCAGGEGPSNFDRLAVMERWVEQKHAPDQIVASRNPTATVPASTRPLCPYPQAAIYKGTGDTNDAANFTCGVR